MQILESTVIGLRSARMTFTRPNSPVEVTLFPMVHIGEAQFYETVSNDACAHDVILIEGVKSPIAVRITRSYRWMVGSQRLGLVLQPSLNEHAQHCGHTVLADLTHEEFLPEWRKISLWLRALIYILAPILGLQRRITVTRESLAKGMSLDDAKSYDELIDWRPESGALSAAILDARDLRLLERLSEQLKQQHVGAHRVAVVYGAMHMRAVIRALTTRHGYRAARAEWITVFSL